MVVVSELDSAHALSLSIIILELYDNVNIPPSPFPLRESPALRYT
jgi:hypothetical protein